MGRLSPVGMGTGQDLFKNKEKQENQSTGKPGLQSPSLVTYMNVK